MGASGFWLDTSTNRLLQSITYPDCSSRPCDYTVPGLVPTTRPVIDNVRNLAPSASCTNYSGGAQPLIEKGPSGVGVPPTGRR